jgi:uncharacterized protein
MREPFLSLRDHLRARLGEGRIRKIAIDAGFSCPNKDGRIGQGGCIFCDEYGSGPVGAHGTPVAIQIGQAIARHPNDRFIAYFQAHTGTDAPATVLAAMYAEALRDARVIGLAVATRPDFIPLPVLPIWEEIAQRTFFWVELGLQSVHDRSLRYLHRNHTYAQFVSAFSLLRGRGLAVVVHLIVGIPGESLADLLTTVAEMNRLGVDGIKIHLLHVLRNTPLETLYRLGQVPLLEQEEYIERVVQLLRHLSPGIVIHRLTGERDPQLFIAPDWVQQKARVLQAIRRSMATRNARQGDLYLTAGPDAGTMASLVPEAPETVRRSELK